jgi:putative AlgH/UPF0301 family transcriptional regulator
MKLKEPAADHVSFTLSHHELGAMGNALNEVCNGLYLTDFESKMRRKPEEFEQILDEIIPVYRKMK